MVRVKVRKLTKTWRKSWSSLKIWGERRKQVVESQSGGLFVVDKNCWLL
jgi:hypothetical protein